MSIAAEEVTPVMAVALMMRAPGPAFVSRLPPKSRVPLRISKRPEEVGATE